MNLSEAVIVVADDEPDLLDIFSQWLLDAGCDHVYGASDGRHASNHFDTHNVDLLITDVQMPFMDGVTLVRTLAAARASLPGIMFVSGAGNVNQREMYGLGVQTFFSKPVSREDLVQACIVALTPCECLWQKPMDTPPRQSLVLLPTDLIPDPVNAPSLSIGRGGFCIRSTAPLAVGKVTFACATTVEGRELRGQGYVRWRSKTDNMVGIEFAYLEPACREWVLAGISASIPKSFIPSC